MFKIKNKNIYLNRGDAVSLTLTLSNDNFKAGDVIKFSVVAQNDYTQVVLAKTFNIQNESPTAEIRLSSTDTRIGSPIKNGSRVYWYEIELNNEITLVGHDENGPKLFTLYPEAGEEK